MFEVFFLVPLISVVWTTSHATFIINGDIGIGFLDNSRVHEYHRPIFHSNLPIHFHDDSRGFTLPHLGSQAIHIIDPPTHHFHNFDETGFSISNVEHGNARHYIDFPKKEQNHHIHQNHKISQQNIDIKTPSTGFSFYQNSNQPSYQHSQDDKKISDSIFKQGHNYGENYYHNLGHIQFNNQHKTTDKTEEKNDYNNINQQKINIKTPNIGFSLHQNGNQPSYQNTQNDKNIPDSIYKQGHNLGGNYYHNIGQIQLHAQNDQHKTTDNQKHVYNKINQQKIVEIGFSKSHDLKNEPKDSFKDYEKKEEKSDLPDYKEEQEQKPYLLYEMKDQNSNAKHNASNYGFQHNLYPAIYSHHPLTSPHYIRIHEDNINRFSELPNNLGHIGSIYRDINVIKYQPDLRAHSRTPILINDNIHANLANQAGYLVELKNDHDLSNLEGYVPYYLLGNNESHVDALPVSKSLDQEDYNSNSNLEQKRIVEEKIPKKEDSYANIADSLSEYREIGNINSPENTDNGKVDLSYQSEQKTVEVEYKGQSTRQTESYGTVSGNEDKNTKEQNSNAHKYSDSNSKNSEYGLEQKLVEVRSSSPKVDYASKIDIGKSYETDTEQKSVDIDFKSSTKKNDYNRKENIGPEYTQQAEIDEPKYPEKHLKNSDEKLEQKSVETEAYKEIKATFKPTHGVKDSADSSHKAYSDHIRGEINGLKTNIDSKISNYETPIYVPSVNHGHPSGGFSSSYFNSRHSPNLNNGFNYGKRNYPSSYLKTGNHIKPKLTQNTDRGHGSDFPKYPTSFGNVFNHHRPIPSSHGHFSGFNYQRPSVFNKPLTIQSNKYFDHKPSYGGISKVPIHSGNSGSFSGSSIPRYHQNPSSGTSYSTSYSPLQYKKSEPHNDEKFVKITYGHPHHSIKKDEQSYFSSKKPGSDYEKPLVNSYKHFGDRAPSYGEHPIIKTHSHPSTNPSSYVPPKIDFNSGNEAPAASYSKHFDRDAKDLGTHITDYLKGDEYPVIGEKSSSAEPKFKSKHSTTEQKSYESDESIPTYSETKSNVDKPSKNEYYGIGEIGTIPSSKSEIVGGRHPIKRPTNTKSTTKSEKKGDDKVEQKYLPITATLSDKKPDSKPYEKSIKTKSPEKTEQQELVYEDLLGGDGPQTNPSVTSGYGFNTPTRGTSYPHASPGKDDENSAPMPYEFHYDIQDDEHGSEQYRREKMDDNGYLTGSYGFKDSEGLFREVEYEASKDGFKVSKIRTNEPGTDNEDPADVHIEVQKHR